MKISKLPRFYKQLALKRQSELGEKYRNTRTYPQPFEKDSIDSFHWSETPEGHLFWSDVHNSLVLEHLPPYPGDYNKPSVNFILLSIQHKT